MRLLTALPCAVALALLGMSIATGAAAQGAWPSKPIRFIVPFPPGGSADVMGRIIATELSKSLSQQFIIENRSGGGGTIGVAAGMKSAPDGYTLFLGATGAMAISPTLVPNLPYDPTRDMAPVSKLVISPLLMTYFLVKVTGKALLERRLKRANPEYAAYIARTSGFFPLPPRR